jgi:hypothetical protein
MSIFDYAKYGDVTNLRKALQEGASANARDEHDVAVIEYAANNGFVECVRLLCDNGADYDNPNLMMTAARRGSVECIQYFLDKGIHVDVTSEEGNTALIFAASAGWYPCVSELIKRGANLDVESLDGFTALSMALFENRFECAHLLLENGASTSNLDLKTVIRTCDHEIVRMILEHMNTVYSDGYDCLKAAISSRKIDMIYLLWEYGADIKNPEVIKYAIGRNVSYLRKVEKTAVLQVLTLLGAPVTDPWLIETCVLNNMAESSKILIDYGADVSVKLYFKAMMTGRVSPKMVQVLREAVKDKMAVVIQSYFRRFMVVNRVTNPNHPWGRSLLNARAARYFPGKT